MRILLTHPFCWPHVRRGGERIFHTLAAFLSGRGHDVTMLTSVPGPSEVERQGNLTIYRERQIASTFFSRIGVPPETAFAWNCLRFLRHNQFDVVGCLHYADGFGAALAQRFQKNPYVLHIMGLPYGSWVRKRPWETWIMSRSMKGADHVVVLSQEADRRLMRYFGRPGTIIGPPTDIDAFPLKQGRDLERPRILGVGAFSEPRKGAIVLMQAFQRLKERVPNAILQYSGNVPEQLKARLLAGVPTEISKDVEFLGAGSLSDLPNLYGAAAVTVLPAVEEAFGLVLVESLACGTPVVGSNTGGIPDIIQEGIGHMFEPGMSRHHPANPDGLCDALLKSLSLHSDPCIHQRCRRSAERFGWQQIGGDIEALYQASARR
jgi:phosphatidyl-myo-inositol alpha-mannosyltransferase